MRPFHMRSTRSEMPYHLFFEGQEPPAEYGEPLDLDKAVPGEDWIINGRRYRETGRTDLGDGHYTISLEDVEYADASRLLMTTENNAAGIWLGPNSALPAQQTK